MKMSTLRNYLFLGVLAYIGSLRFDFAIIRHPVVEFLLLGWTVWTLYTCIQQGMVYNDISNPWSISTLIGTVVGTIILCFEGINSGLTWAPHITQSKDLLFNYLLLQHICFKVILGVTSLVLTFQAIQTLYKEFYWNKFNHPFS